ncbi:hypothetical protein FOCC_FOCC011120 [Frankliniella occidentalis]|uniref:Solute carrier family 35 member E2A n=1 Tax=Frankliniella occidentalis TaxID=133901 RepID=A0A6J1RYT3_FRAOC|nr:solute carrier family 35 member E2A [Frankliniella occidentalis]XP_026272101.1 solute carrier family 35 member E2A [Frankliniella occidentalis]KAE8743291.1 hypothetical protein FOCC_FOCC011120 [Frankliniella occidentalis]
MSSHEDEVVDPVEEDSQRLSDLEVLAESGNGLIRDAVLSDESSEANVVHHHRVITETAENKAGLWNIRAIRFLVLWYFFSGCTLFLNKYILTFMRGDPMVLGICQMFMTTLCGCVQMYYPCGMYKPVQRLVRPPGFYRHMVLVGCTRFVTVVLGLVSLKFIAVSFTETIKSSAPIFTVLISKIVLGEHTGLYVNLSLVPVMSGLALCSANELSFNTQGFLSAMATNITECLQNVLSKMLISGDKFRYTPAELQFYTSMAAMVVLIPGSWILMDLSTMQTPTDIYLWGALFFNGLLFHFQSITAYVLMDYISPVTHSVANTGKRAFLIWLSVLLFGNPVTVLSAIGTCTVILGVLLYNKAQEIDSSQKRLPVRHTVRGTRAL